MKRTLLFLAIILGSLIQLEARNFEEYEILTVVAPSGLMLRTNPNQHSKAINMIEFGDEVKVVHRDETLSPRDVIDWTEGQWIMVEYGGEVGYVFDGFLTDLPLPTMLFEKVQEPLEFVSPMESWVNHHFINTSPTETIQKANGNIQTVDLFDNGQKMVRSDFDEYFKMEVYLADVRLMDGYNLLTSMLTSKDEIATFKNKTIFIEDNDGKLKRIKINLDDPIYIDKYQDDKVKISLYASNYGKCNL